MAKQQIFVAAEGSLYQGGSGNDTIRNFTGKFSANTIQAGAGNDLITFAHETTAIAVTGTRDFNAKTAGTQTIAFNGPSLSAGAVFAAVTGTYAATAGAATKGVATFASLRNTALLTGQHSFIQGGAGNDSVFFGDYLADLSGITVEGGQGNDLIGSYNSGASTAGKFNTVFIGNKFRGAKGNDVINVDVSATSASKFQFNGNSGNDTVIFSAVTNVVVDVVSGNIQGGKGNDNIVYTNSAAGSSNHVTIGGGMGNDIVTVKEMGTNFASGLIALDNSNADSGKDTLTVDFDGWSGTSIYGYNGVDSIVLSALLTDGGNNIIDAGRGNDLIEFDTATFIVSGSTIQGGQGNDMINNSASVAATNGQVFKSSLIRLGAGTDTLALSASVESAGIDGLTVVGGAGADALTVQAIGTAGSGTFAFESYADSTLGASDTVLFQTAGFSKNAASQASAHVNFTIPDAVSLATGSTTAVGNGISGVSGVIAFSGVSDNLTSRVGALDAAFTTTGTVAFFTVQDNNEFIFVQGGANDLVVKINDSTVLSAGIKDGTLAVQYSGKAFGFGG
jgi:hypothetical protein